MACLPVLGGDETPVGQHDRLGDAGQYRPGEDPAGLGTHPRREYRRRLRAEQPGGGRPGHPKPGTALPPQWQAEPGIHDGKDTFAALAERAGASWPTTYTVVTPSGGWHLYYAAPAGTEIRNSASKLAPMVDVRASGGYVIGAGSVVGGKAYTALVDEDDPEPLPGWLLTVLTEATQSSAERGSVGYVSTVSTPSRYALAALEAELDRVMGAPEGTRNTSLNEAAFSLGQLCAGGQLASSEVALALEDAAISCGLPVREAQATIRSGLRAGSARPRSAA
jgi:hypothetical protein